MTNGTVNVTELIAAMICEKDNFVEGIQYVQERIDGSMFSCTSLGVKLGGGIGVALSGWLLDISGYINLDNAVQPDSCINMMYFMYLWLPFIFDIVIAVILSFLNVERANMKLKENMLNQ